MVIELARARRITIHCPISRETLAALAAGDTGALARDPQVQPLVRYIESSTVLGNFGLYHGVCEVVLGLEAFTPAAAATPTLGRAGERVHSPTAVVSTYLVEPLTDAELETLVGALAERHPWEIPVIEVSEVRLARRNTAG